jgi:type I restriction enzyme, S subunit
MTKDSLPAHWKLVSMADVAEERPHALVIGPFGSDLKTSDYRDDGVPIVFVRDVQPNRFSPQQRRFVSEAKARALAAHTVHPGDLVITKMGTPPCVAAVYPSDERPGIVTADIIKMSVEEARADRDYVAWFLNTEHARSQVAGITFGITRPKVTLRDFRQIQIPLPPLPEQRRIAEVLDRAEALRAKRRAALAQLDKLTQAIFLNIFGDPAVNPAGWPEAALADVCTIAGEYGAGVSSKEFDPELPRYIRITDITESGELTPDPVSPSGEPRDWEAYELRAGDILFARSGATVGKTYLHREGNGTGVFAGYLIRFRPDQDQLLPEFLFHFTRTGMYRAWVASRQRVVAQPNINARQYGHELELPMPPIPLQHEFARRAAAVERLKAAHRASLAELDALFASLQHRAFRGEL